MIARANYLNLSSPSCLIPSSSQTCILTLSCTRWVAYDSTGLLESLSPSLLTFILHRPQSISINLSLDHQCMLSTVTSYPKHAHHEPKNTSSNAALWIPHHLRMTAIIPHDMRFWNDQIDNYTSIRHILSGYHRKIHNLHPLLYTSN